MTTLLWKEIGSTVITELLCDSKFDGIVLDNEHGVFNPETLFSCIQLARASDKQVYVRFAYLDKTPIRMCLDAGCTGIIMSTVETYDQAKDFADFCLYPPCGKRGQGLVRQNGWGKMSLKLDYSPVLIPQIETVEGVSNICDIRSLDFPYYLIGPYDLSASCGDVGNFESDGFIAQMEILKESLGDRIGYHLPSDVVNKINEEISSMKFLALGMDTIFIREAVDKLEQYCL
jgi:2-keto-3-deoxy-L-rhamnonate aldolase RhmA